MKIRIILISLLVTVSTCVRAQEKPSQWDLTGCINYALENNIQIQKSKITLDESSITTKQAKAQLFPNLSASVNQSFTNRPLLENGGTANSYTGSYGLSSSMTLFNGGKTVKNIQQQKLQEEVNQYLLADTKKSLEMSILQTYLQILYADESVKINQATLDVSTYQLTRSKSLLKAGSISQADLAQLESQLSSDKYQLVVSENNLSSNKLALKQLLELTVNEDMNISIPALDETDILKPLPSLQSIYETSLTVMPQLKSSRINTQIAALETSKAKAGYLPTVNLNASAGTNHSSSSDYNFNEQLKNGLNEGIGLSVSIPIFNNRETKSTVEKARLEEKNSQLNLIDAEKNLLKEIESVYQDAISAQSQYAAAAEKVKALQTSYKLVEQQYNLGMKNTLELLTEKNNLLAAQQSMLQAKYMSIMNTQLLNIYQDMPVEIK
ncbi:MAG: TolC family protein [Bacteroidales bacterium]|nr:TolC family protein [Bacteroidales bacterium]